MIKFLFLLACNSTDRRSAEEGQVKTLTHESIIEHDKQTRVIHILVALCDNENQGIVPVPKAIGNGQDPGNNLY